MDAPTPRRRPTAPLLHLLSLLATMGWIGLAGLAPLALTGCASGSAAPGSASGQAAVAARVAVADPLAEPPAPPVPTSLDATLPSDPTVRKGRLDNGLTYYVRHNAAPESRAELWLVVNAGSLLEDKDQRGLAHFIEHMAFNGTRHFKHQQLVDYLESIGMKFGPDVNAYTSYDETVFLLQVPTDRPGGLDKGLQILEDWADGVAFDPKDVEQERGVVTEEWRLGRGAEGRLMDAEIPLLFAGSRYADRLPIGSLDVIANAPREALQRFYHDWYRPDLMAVIAVGDFDAQRVERTIRRRFSDLENPENPRPRTTYQIPDHDKTLFATFTDPELTVTSVSVYTKLPRPPEDTVGDYRRGLVEGLYHGMINDRLYEIGHRPDPPFLYAYSQTDSLVRTADLDQQEAGVTEGGVLPGLEALLTEIERVHRYGFTAGELERTKKRLLRAYERTWVQRENRSSGSYAAEYSRNFLEGEPIPGIAAEVEMARRYLPGITLDEVNALAQVRTKEANRVILLTGPKAAADSLPSEDDLLAVFQKVQSQPVAPYADTAPDGPLLSQAPTPGTIVSRDEIKKVGVTEWTLSNGVRVVLKPTDLRKDQVLLTGFSPGGHSLVPDADHLSGSYAAEVVSLGGLGDHDELALAKLMAGKVAQVSPFIDELEEGVHAAGSADDLETIFQLVHLALTAPRLDREAIRSYKDRIRPLLENRLADPEQVFVEEMYKHLTGDNPRRQPLTPERLDAIDPDKALAIYRDRFADASDFTFVVVGSFDLDAIEPLVTTYLGSLPSTGRKETWRDIGIQRPDKPEEVTVRKGIEPKAEAWIVLGQPVATDRVSRTDRRAFSALAQALQIRLREVMREDLGAVYDVSVSAEIAWRPVGRATTSIRFGCAPDRAQDLVETVHREIERLRDGKIAPQTVAKVREILLRQHESDLEDNAFWLGALADAYRRGESPTSLLDFDDTVSRLSAEQLAATARRFVDWQTRVVGLLLPEDQD